MGLLLRERRIKKVSVEKFYWVKIRDTISYLKKNRRKSVFNVAKVRRSSEENLNRIGVSKRIPKEKRARTNLVHFIFYPSFRQKLIE